MDSLYGNLIDVTADHKYRHDLKLSNKKLEERNIELRQFIKVASHDLKSPLRAISNLSKWISEDEESKLSEQSTSDFLEINKRALRMQSLLDGLLQYSKVGRAKEEPTEIDLAEVVGSYLEVAEKPSSYNIHFNNLPVISSYKNSIELIFRNLIQNSINYRSSNEGNLWIEYFHNDSGEHSIIFRDDGKGIAKQEQEVVFKMFKTGSNANQKSTGVGLALVERALINCKGNIEVESDGKGKGAIFKVTFPEINKNVTDQA